MIKYRRTSNAQSVEAGRTKITLWRRMRAGGLSREFISWDGNRGWTCSIAWGRPRAYSRLAFHISIEHRNR